VQPDNTSSLAHTSDMDWSSIPQMFDACCTRYASKTALVDAETRITFDHLRDHVNQMTCALYQLGIQRDEKVCIWAENSWRWVVCAFALWQLGAIVVPISSRLKAKEAGPVIKHSGARLLITQYECAGNNLSDMLAVEYGLGHKKPFNDLNDITALLYLDHGLDLSTALSHRYCYSAFLDLSAGVSISDAVCSDVKGSDLCEVLYTSGTTGEPKGVMLRHRQVLQSFWDWSGLGGLRAGDKFMVIPPFSHGFGINAGILACLMRGISHIVIPMFNADDVFRLIDSEKINVMSGPPALFSTLMNRADLSGYDLSSLRVAYVGAATVPTEIIYQLRDVLGFDRVINAYGLIEGCVVTMTRAQDSDQVISATVGRKLPGVSVRIVDEARQCRDVGVSGEIQVSGDNVMQGYFDNKKKTDEVIDSDGWLSTGDLGQLDDKGNLYILGRKKEMYICNGFNVYPAEVESLLLQLEGIAQLAVVGIDDQQKGEVGVAFVVVKNGHSLTTTQVVDWASKNMAAYKVPKKIIIKPDLPLNANGKVIKDELIKMAQKV
jgi:HIP---CoA ligase